LGRCPQSVPAAGQLSSQPADLFLPFLREKPLFLLSPTRKALLSLYAKKRLSGAKIAQI